MSVASLLIITQTTSLLKPSTIARSQSHLLVLNGGHSDYNRTKSQCGTGKGKEIQQNTCLVTPPQYAFSEPPRAVRRGIHQLCRHKTYTSRTLTQRDRRSHCETDPTLQTVTEAVRTDKWHALSEWPQIDPNAYSSFAHIGGEL